MTLLPIRPTKARLSHVRRAAHRARVVFRPHGWELEGRTLLSTLTVMNNQASGPGSLPQEVAQASSGDTIDFAPGLAGETIRLSAPLSFSGSLTFDGVGTSGP